MNNSASDTTDFLSILVRLLGLVMLLIGLFVGIKVIFQAWELYKEPQNIERFADAIEQGSHLDVMLAKFTPHPTETVTQQPLQKAETSTESLSLTYFLAWIIAVLLLMVIGGLASSAIRTGGQLALYDLQVKRFARQLIEEARKTDRRD